jgi:hypothetical protein
MSTQGADQQIAEWRDRYDAVKIDRDQLRIFADEMKRALNWEHSERIRQVALNTELQTAIGKERDQVERLGRALFVLNARFHSVCNGIGPHVSALYLDDLAEVRALLADDSISSKEPTCPTTPQSKNNTNT